MIPYGTQHIDAADIEAVVEVLKSSWLTQGPAIERFEYEIGEYCQARHAIAVSNGTAALHIACLALGLGPGDTLWTSPNTFVASANCALYCGAAVDFVDIDPRSYNISVEALESKLRKAASAGTLPKVLVPVHFGGQSCDMRAIRNLADKYGFAIIEDASHAVGGQYLGEPVGNCRYSDITVFSFHPVKIITTAEGGLTLTNRQELADKMHLLRSHGITRDPSHMAGRNEGQWYYQQVALGFNYRITDIQAALGCSQLRRIDKFVTRRQELAARYERLLTELPVKTPWQHPDCYSAYHLYPIHVDEHRSRKTRSEVFDSLRTSGIGVNVHYIPVHLQPYYQQLGFRAGQFPVAEEHYAKTITLPLFSQLSEKQQDDVVEALHVALT